MTEARKVANHLGSQVEKAFSYEEQVRPYLEEIRDHIDHLELEIDDEIWPLPNIVNYCSPNKISHKKERIGDKNLSFCYFLKIN